MRILAIDYGEKRIGLAVSDELEITARGISFIERKTNKTDFEANAAPDSE
jgi:putative Holliday junction resolvase